ncbi:MAG: nucleotidyltransferase substrate binding protein [Deltaproteobacteria bacterium]|nr:nucleotidyltransferase substrate binding protein [Deltaproteobacteria bacterium]
MGEDVIILGHLVITPLLRARTALDDVLKQPTDLYTRDAAIQRFEFCFELSWKTMKRILDYRGIRVNSPREVFREAAREGLVDDPKLWFEFLDSRNETVHTYNEATAEAIFRVLPNFLNAMTQFIAAIRNL